MVTVRILAIVVFISMAPLAAMGQPEPEGLHRVAYDDAGVPGKQPHLAASEGDYRYPDGDLAAAAADEAARTVAYGAAVRFRYDGLRPGARYKVRLTYLSENPGRAQRLSLDGVVLQEHVELPADTPVTTILDLPANTVADGEAEFLLTTLTGPNAVVSAIELWSSEATLAPHIEIMTHGNYKGSLEGLVTDINNDRPVAGADVTATIEGSAFRVLLATRPDGEFSLAVPRKYWNDTGKTIRIHAVKDALEAESLVPLEGSALSFARLSPRGSTVEGMPTPAIDLCGTWRFHPAPPPGFAQEGDTSSPGWAGIAVPGEWVMQGFHVEKGAAAAYFRTFRIPAEWKTQRIKLRCDAVYSLCTVWVNGTEMGHHEGGFTPFELDVTRAVHFEGDNTIAIAVTNESLADTLASATAYAAHPLGGIPRALGLFAVPEANIASYHLSTTFDADYCDATLKAELEVANEGRDPETRLTATFVLHDSAGMDVALASNSVEIPGVDPGAAVSVSFETPVRAPAKWDPEHPNRYSLKCTLNRKQKPIESVERRFGFRQVEVRGNQLFVNGNPVKVHGVCRHETHPTRGRSLTPELWRQDAMLFRDANVNYIRTSHYPPAEEFIDACDELGLFVEEEAPLCWVGHDANPAWNQWNPRDTKYRGLILAETHEMIERDRSHPSIIYWSLANESLWSDNFDASSRMAAEADPTRPRSFHDQAWGKYNNAGSHEPVGNYHYPGPEGPARVAGGSRPVLFGEYCHLNAYNREELVTDPSLRDYWGRALAPMWDAMWNSQGCLGGALWSGIDDVFHLPSGESVGYGAWGVIDAWRRPKPEYWHVKKSYSPVHLLTRDLAVPAPGESLTLHVENRHDFTNLSELRIEWAIGEERGTATASVAPHATGTIAIRSAQALSDGMMLDVAFHSPRGFLIDRDRLAIGQPSPVSSGEPHGDALSIRKSAAATFAAASDDVAWRFDTSSGKIQGAEMAGRPVLAGGPDLMVLPLKSGACATTYRADTAPWNDTCHGWKPESVVVKNGHTLVARGSYDEASGEIVIQVMRDGTALVTYDFTMRIEANPRQIGLVFTLPRACDTLAWKRHGQWSWYPEDHIGRLEGTAKAFGEAPSPLADARVEPTIPWMMESNALGTNDFRSSKYAIEHATLTDSQGFGIEIDSSTSQTVRTWVDGDVIRLLVADYANAGGEPFVSSHFTNEQHPLKPGSTVKGAITLRLRRPG